MHGENAMERKPSLALARLTVAWLTGVLSIGTAAAQRCDGIEVEIGANQQRCLKPGTGQSFKDCPDCPEMVVIPAGSFTMGARPDEEVATEREDQMQASIARPFAVGRFAVTRGEFAAFVAATGHKTGGGCYRLSEPKLNADRNWGSPGFAQHDRHPVVCVNWNDAKAYAAWMSSLTGKNYRLLSEVEREYVTRAGSTGPFWWGSRDFNRPGQLQWQHHLCRRRQRRVAPGDSSRRSFQRQSVGTLQRAWQRLGMDGGLLE